MIWVFGVPDDYRAKKRASELQRVYMGERFSSRANWMVTRQSTNVLTGAGPDEFVLGYYADFNLQPYQPVWRGVLELLPFQYTRAN